MDAHNIWKWLNCVTTNLYLNCTLCVTQYDTEVWIIMWYNSISSPMECLSCEYENNKEFNILIIASNNWIEELEIFIYLHNLFYLPLTANQEPSCMSKNPSHYLLHTCKYHPHSAHNTLCGSLPQCISRPGTNFWLASKAKQAVGNQQCQCPLGQASLATADIVADLRYASQSVWATLTLRQQQRVS
jgi:hypothetical protein